MKTIFAILMIALIVGSASATMSIRMSSDSGSESGSQIMNFDLNRNAQLRGQTVTTGGYIASDIAIDGPGKNSLSMSSGQTTMDTQSSDGLSGRLVGDPNGVRGGLNIAGLDVPVLSSPDAMYSVDMLGVSPDGGILSVGSLTTVPAKAPAALTLTGPAITPGGGNANAYLLTGRKWIQKDPQIKMQLTNDANFAKTGLTTAGVLGAINAATNTWDDATNQNLFSDSGASLTTVQNWKLDGVNDIAFRPYAAGCTALASAGTWYQIKGVAAGQPYPILESDISFNSNYKWSTSSGVTGVDFQSVAVHELGHTIGLGDLYGRAAFTKDTRQVMHYYTGIKRTLGNGDATGVWKLYG